MNEFCNEPEYSGNDHSQTLNTEITIEWSNDDVINAVVKEMASYLYSDMKDTIVKEVYNTLNARVNEAILDVMTRTVQETDRWGNVTGPEETITGLLQRDVEKWMTDKVDSYGKPSGGYHNKPRIEYLFLEALNPSDNYGNKHRPIQDMVINAIKEQIGDVAEIVNAQVAEAVKAKFAK